MKRRFSRLGQIGVVGVFCWLPVNAVVAEEGAGLPKVKHMIDTHIHLYDTAREGGVPWPPEDDKVLYKPHLPAEFRAVSKPTGATGVVVVEASDIPGDNEWVLQQAGDDGYFVGLVGNIDPYRDDFEARLVELSRDVRFVGVRARNGRGKKAIDLADEKVLESFRVLVKHGKSVDILVNGGGVAAVKSVDRLARALPALRIVVDHVLGYDFDGGSANPEWVAAVEKLGENKNVWCKISGLYQRSQQQPAAKEIGFYRPVLEVLWKNLGAERLVFGSNWPCTKATGDYESFVRVVNSYFAEKGQEASERYFWKNASEVYKLGLK